ncbi:unnamed protein product [Effrenium voratum]|nr:unnamed protein product [Effrenium voratum]
MVSSVSFLFADLPSFQLQVYKRLAGRSERLEGFLMEERRLQGRRVGFDCCALEGTRRVPLASVEGPSTGHMVGKYHVQVEEFERFTVPILDRVLSESGQSSQDTVLIFDEIGKMELFSSAFVSRIRRLLESSNPKLHVLGTVAVAGGGFIAQSKRIPGVELVEISVQDRDAKTEEVAARFLALSKEQTEKATQVAETARARGRWRPKAKVTPEAFDPPARTCETPPEGALAMGKADYGQLGRGQVSSEPALLRCEVSAVSCGFDHTGLVSGGQLLLCGRNNRGQCGRPSGGQRGEKDPPDWSEDVLEPAPVALPSSSTVRNVACGGDHTLVLLENGEVFACGDHSSGQLGIGAGPKMSPQLRPVRVGQAQAVSAGFRHSAAVCGDQVYLWGANNQGQLGVGRRQSAQPEPQLLELGPVRQVALGRWHSLVLGSVVWAFGWGRFGVLGQGDFNDHHSPVRIDLPEPVHCIASGAVHCGAICGPRRQVFLWGRGSLGRLGFGGEANVLKPRPLDLDQVEHLALGGDFSAAKTAEDWWVWGKNEEGQLGFKDRQNRLAPTRAPQLQSFGRVVLGDCHAENAAGSVSEAVTSCAKFFCLQAEGKEPLKKELLLELREGLAFLLQTMCKAGNALAIKCLLGVAAGGRQHLMAMQSQSGNNPTGLHLAAVSGHKDVVEILLALAPEPMQLCLAVNADGMAPLHCAARDGHEATARALLQRAPDGFHLLQMPMKNSSALRPLHLAAKHGHVEVVKCFLDFAPNPAALCVEASAGNTALHFAAAGGHTVVAQAILSYAGQSKELSDRATLLLTAVNRFDRQTALHVAADKGEKEVVETLLGAAPDRTALLQMSDKLGQTALHLAAEKGHGAVVHKLLTPADHVLVSARERITGQSALHMAAESGHTAAVRAILTASPYRETSLATDRGGRCTPLHLAAERGHLETVRTLVELCPDIDGLLLAQERFAGQTALHLAAGAGHAELCKVLLELAPNASTLLAAKDKSGGFTPLQLACEKGQTGVVETLLESDPDRGSRLKDTLEKWNGFSALHLVAYRGHEEAAKALLRLAPDRRALLALKDQKGRTPGDLAVDRGRRPVASLLSET